MYDTYDTVSWYVWYSIGAYAMHDSIMYTLELYICTVLYPGVWHNSFYSLDNIKNVSFLYISWNSIFICSFQAPFFYFTFTCQIKYWKQLPITSSYFINYFCLFLWIHIFIYLNFTYYLSLITIIFFLKSLWCSWE